MQNVLDKAQMVLELCNRYTEEELGEHPLIQQAISSLKEWHRIGIQPFGESSTEEDTKQTKCFSLDMISRWTNIYREAMQHGHAAAFCIGIDAIDRKTLSLLQETQ